MGGLCFMVNGKMCVGVEKDRLMVRLDPDEYDSLLSRPGCAPIDFTGRPMRGFVWVHGEGLREERDIRFWIGRALAFNPRARASKSRRSPS